MGAEPDAPQGDTYDTPQLVEIGDFADLTLGPGQFKIEGYLTQFVNQGMDAYS
jgi:hypothetical protein